MQNLTTSPHPRWTTIRECIDLAQVVTTLLGPTKARRGEHGHNLWWVCPFHNDRNPSLCVTPGKRNWCCFACGAQGDAMALVRRLNPEWSFPTAVQYLADNHAPPIERGMITADSPANVISAAPKRPRALSPSDAASLVGDAAVCLWTPPAEEAVVYLRGRGLSEATIRAACLGWRPSEWPSGIVIPWFNKDALVLVKVRRLGSFNGPRYLELFRDHPTMYPSPSLVRPGKPLVIVEGEFDALLLGQELADLAVVVTLGSASARPEAAALDVLLDAPVWYVATDADQAGDVAADQWPDRVVRVRPPGPYKDWTEAHQAGVKLRRWWAARLG
jgi:DNA primase